jgi:hypothetical protein
MADNIVGGLFGIMPEDVAAQRMAAIDQQAQAFGRMSGREANRALGYKAGTLLGQGLFGVNDPQMERARQRQQMTQGIDFNDPKSLLQAAQRANQMGDSPAAQALYAKAVKAQQAQAELLETQAKTTKALREQEPDKVRIAAAFANNNAEPGTQEWKDAFTEALNNQLTPRGGSTPVTLQQQQLIAKLEGDISEGKPLDERELNQARFILGKLKQPKTIYDSQTGEAVQVPGNNINELAPNLATRLFGGNAPTSMQPQVAGQPPMAAQPQGAPYAVTTLPTAKSEAIKAKEAESVKAIVKSLNSDLSNVDEAIKRTTPLATGWGAFVFENMPDSQAMALKDIVTSLNAAKVFTELGKLKEQSKTGASGLGSITEKEIDLLEARIRKLNPKSKTFPEDLKYIQKTWKDLRDSTQVKLGQTPSPTPTRSDEDIIALALADPRSKGFTREQVISGLRKAGRINNGN